MKKITIVMLFVLVFTLAIAVAPASACPPCGQEVGTPGYWKNHPDEWPVDTIEVMGDEYTKDEALDWLKSPVKKDKSITMFKAYVAAFLNKEAGNCYACIADELDEAYEWLGKYPVGSDVPAKSEAWQYSHGEQIYWTLDAYNNGYLCAAARD